MVCEVPPTRLFSSVRGTERHQPQRGETFCGVPDGPEHVKSLNWRYVQKSSAARGRWHGWLSLKIPPPLEARSPRSARSAWVGDRSVTQKAATVEARLRPIGSRRSLARRRMFG